MDRICLPFLERILSLTADKQPVILIKMKIINIIVFLDELINSVLKKIDLEIPEQPMNFSYVMVAIQVHFENLAKSELILKATLFFFV